MAKFQIYLMNLRNIENEFSPTYSLMPISDFKTQYHENDAIKNIPIQMSDLIIKEQNQEDIDLYRDKRKYSTANFEQDNSFCYTYDEEFQIHQNTQRTLTFSMNQNFIRADRIEKNPFINYLFIGAQLLLIDKYDNHHLMTISKISYDFKSHNTVFNYECQDSFNYQLSRQNSGYEIENNIESTNFLGAHSLDWWVLCKIHPECKISYQYLQLGQLNTDVKKPQYDYNTYPDFYRTVPFSASGTANSVLIALGELYGLQLRVYERVLLSSGKCMKYYWFEPMKSLRPTGLKYSPYVDLQSFSLEHNSTSFSSILNIQSHTVGEEMITVLPSVPNFFRQWFETKEWSDSKFVHGLFTSACTENSDCIQYNQQAIVDKSDLNGIIQSYRENEIFYHIESGNVYIPIKPTSWSYKYDLLKFTTVGGTYSILNIDGIKEEDLSDKTMGYNSKFTNWEVIYKIKNGIDENGKEVKFEEAILYSTQTELPISLIKKYGLDYCFLKLYFEPKCKSLVVDGKLYIAQYRIPSTEELEFAEIADQMPWLENKLIDFSYFYEHAIINASEHHQLMQLLENDLRKANAKLLLYSQLYYQAIQNKTKIIANLSAKIDKIGAVFQADLINPFMLDGRAKETTEFNLALSDLFANSSEPIKLITYYETLSDYVNKYFNAEQTFLKNMYLFRDYFESKSNLGTIYSYYFTLPDENQDEIVTFNAPERYVKLISSNQYNTIYEKQDEVYILYDKNEIINKNNYYDNNIYYLDPFSDNKRKIETTTPEYLGYSDEQVYYELQWEVKDEDLIKLIFQQKNGEYTYIETFSFNESADNLFTCTLSNDHTIMHVACKNHCLHTTDKTPNWHYNNVNGNSQSVRNITHVYVKVSYTEMRVNFFYQQLTQEDQTNNLLRYMHRRNTGKETTLRSVSNWKNFHDLGLSGSLLEALGHNKNISDSDLKNLTAENSKEAETVYKQCFPISSYYWKGKAVDDKGQEAEQEDYHSVPFVNVENASQFYRRVSVSLEEYKNWQIGLSITGAVGLLGLIPFIPLGTLATVAVAPAIWGICQACWNNGEKTFNNTGWSFHDIFNCDVESFQGWNTSDRLLYTKTATSYAETHGKNIFPNNIDGEKWTETTPTINEEAWGYREATNLLLTYYSLSARLTASLKEQYFYETSYYRILTKDDYIDQQDNFLMLWYSNNDITNLITIPQDLKINSATKHLERLDSIIYYPLKNHISSVSGSNYKWPENVNRMCLGDLLENNQMTAYTLESNYIFKDNSSENSSAKVIYLKEEKWIYDDLTDKKWESIGYDNIYQLAASNLYYNDTFEQVNLITKYPQLTIGFYVTGTEESDYLPAKQLNSLDENKDYFKKVNNTYERRYTINQLINQPNMYVKLSDTYYYQSFSDVDEIKVQYYIYKRITKDNATSFDLVESPLGTLKKQNSQWQLVGETITKDCEVRQYQEDLSNYTNGYFWYTYRNSTSSLLMEKAMLIETNLMEYWTNAYYASKNCKYFLPEYWQPTVNQQQNYFSSDIISPQSRDIEVIETNIIVKQPTQSNIDLLTKSISITNCTTTSTSDAGWTTIQIETNDNVEFYQIEFNDILYVNPSGQQPIKGFIIDNTQIDQDVTITRPINTITSGTVRMKIQIQNSKILIVEIPTKSFTNTDEYKAKLTINITTVKKGEPVYSTTSKPAEFLLSSIYIPQIKKVPNQWRYQFRHKAIMDNIEDTRAAVNNLSIGNSVGLNTLTSSVIPVQNAMSYLNINTLDWKAVRLQNDYVLYEYISGGTLWTQILDKLSGGALINNQFGGWYDMMIKALQTCNYDNYNPVQYQQAQEEHDIIWRQVYTKYPNLCYEQSYTNEDATSSRELLQMAQWAFKDYTSTESNYNITVIDPNTLKGYRGQELKIGDGIEIDADELYDNFHSDIYHSLTQYLYITDISYDLRNDDNIQLTVNSIKYQDKVIGQLIKLIR